MEIGVNAEYNQLENVVIKEPSIESRMGTNVPPVALFQGAFDSDEAKEEFKNLKEYLGNVATVYNVDDILINDRNSLERLAKISNNVQYQGINLMDRHKIDEEVLSSLGILSNQNLLEIILTQPTTNIKYSNINTGFIEEKTVSPLYNLIFCRDQQITTNESIIMGKMNSVQRGSETVVMKQVFENLGIKNVYSLENNDAKLEGGDFIPAGDVAFIGCGLRTNEIAVKELLEKNMLNYQELVVVNDAFKSQDEMHLDTYFNIFGKEKVGLLESRFENKGKMLLAEVYRKNGGGIYEKVNSMPFSKYLTQKDYEIIPISEEEQRSYAINFLTLKENEVLGVDISAKQDIADRMNSISKKCNTSLNASYKSDFRKIGYNFMEKMDLHGITYIPLKFNMLNMMYGSVHCMTQAIKRNCSK